MTTPSDTPRADATAEPCPRCGYDGDDADIQDGRCFECRLHEDEADWTDEAEGPLN